MKYTVETNRHGIIIYGEVPIKLLPEIYKAHFSRPNKAVMVMDVARKHGALMAVARDDKAAAKWRLEYDWGEEK